MNSQGPAEQLTKAAPNASVQVLFAMIGSVCGTLLTGAFDTSPAMRLVGAVLGAAIPTLITYAGPYSNLRASVGILVTAGALFLTYGGFTLFDFAADRPKTFPLPPKVPEPNADAGTVTTTAGQLGVEVTPDTLHCSSDGCEEPVTIKSTGERLLRTYAFEFEGEAAGDFSHGSECEGRYLRKGEECRFSVDFSPSGSGGTRKANLLIHHNVGAFPTTVAVEGEGGGGGGGTTPVNDLVVSSAGLSCVYQRGGAIVSGVPRDAIQIFFSLQIDGPSLGHSVFVTARSSRGGRGQNNVSEGQPDVALPLEPDDYGHLHTVFVLVDADHEVPETNEDNNQLRVRVWLPRQPASPQSLYCSTK
jgi:hypothetical protein